MFVTLSIKIPYLYLQGISFKIKGFPGLRNQNILERLLSFALSIHKANSMILPAKKPHKIVSKEVCVLYSESGSNVLIE